MRAMISSNAEALMLLPETSVGAAVGMALRLVRAVVVRAAMAVATVSGLWWGSDGVGVDDSGGFDDGGGGGPEAVFQRIVFRRFLAIVQSLY